MYVYVHSSLMKSCKQFTLFIQGKGGGFLFSTSDKHGQIFDSSSKQAHSSCSLITPK